PSHAPPRHCLRGFRPTQSSRTNGRIGMPVCAAVGGPVSAATLTRTLRGWTAPVLRWAARRHSGPPSVRQRARTAAAPCLTIAAPTLPEGAHVRKAPAPRPSCPCRCFLPPPRPQGTVSLVGTPEGRRLRRSCRLRVVARPSSPGRPPNTVSACLYSTAVFSPSL